MPFIAAAMLPLLGYDSLPHLGPLDQLVASYGLAIVCFLSPALTKIDIFPAAQPIR